MTRSARLIDLMQALRRHRRPVTAQSLAAEFGVSQRTIYRDIATLVAQGVSVTGEAGLGYVLQPGFLLPPLMFSEDEIDAVMLGLSFAAQRGDRLLASAARGAAAKICAVLPSDLRPLAEVERLVSGPETDGAVSSTDLSLLRKAIRDGLKLSIGYIDLGEKRTERVIWPFAIAFFEGTRVLAAWCEMRRDFRHFRIDRIETVQVCAKRAPKRAAVLVAEWRARQKREGAGSVS